MKRADVLQVKSTGCGSARGRLSRVRPLPIREILSFGLIFNDRFPGAESSPMPERCQRENGRSSPGGKDRSLTYNANCLLFYSIRCDRRRRKRRSRRYYWSSDRRSFFAHFAFQRHSIPVLGILGCGIGIHARLNHLLQREKNNSIKIPRSRGKSESARFLRRSVKHRPDVAPIRIQTNPCLHPVLEPSQRKTENGRFRSRLPGRRTPPALLSRRITEKPSDRGWRFGTVRGVGKRRRPAIIGGARPGNGSIRD